MAKVPPIVFPSSTTAPASAVPHHRRVPIPSFTPPTPTLTPNSLSCPLTSDPPLPPPLLLHLCLLRSRLLLILRGRASSPGKPFLPRAIAQVKIGRHRSLHLGLLGLCRQHWPRGSLLLIRFSAVASHYADNTWRFVADNRNLLFHTPKPSLQNGEASGVEGGCHERKEGEEFFSKGLLFPISPSIFPGNFLTNFNLFGTHLDLFIN